MDVGKLDFNSITGIKEVDQKRALRLILSVLEDDFTQLGSVSEEVARDTRSADLAIWELCIGMAATVAQVWVDATDIETAKKAIQEALLSDAREGLLDG